MSADLKYQIQFVSSAAKEFRNLPIKIQEQTVMGINALTLNPLPAGSKKLRGKNDYYRLRVGVYRIV